MSESSQSPKQATESEPSSPPLPNAEHFPNTAKLLHERRSKSPTPEVSPSRHQQRDGSSTEVSPSKAPSNHHDDGMEGDAEGEALTRRAGARRRMPSSRSTQALADRVHEKMEQAQQRRDQLLDERAERLRKAEQHRQRKTQLQRQMRHEALQRFIKEAPALLGTMNEAGLAVPVSGGADKLDNQAIQHALMTDPRVCNHCTDGSTELYQRVCPVTNKPHRRKLVVIAEQLLKLIGETRVNLVVRKDAVGDQTLAMSNSKGRRGIAVNPQLFVLAYYNACVGEQDQPDDPLVRASACQLVECVAEIDKVLRLNVPGNETAKSQTEAAMKPLLLTFSKHWQQYAKLADLTPPQAKKEPRANAEAAGELLESTITTALFVHRNWKEVEVKDMDPVEKQNTLASLQAYSQMLFHRALSIGGQQGVEKLKQRLAAAETQDPVANPEAVTAGGAKSTLNAMDSSEEEGRKELVEPSSPLLPTAPVLVPQGAAPRASDRRFANASDSVYTSGSETDVGRWNNNRQRSAAPKKPMGPELPPRWYVDEQGISRPPRQPTEEELKREQFKELEHKAKTSYEAKLSAVFKDSTQEYTDPMEAFQKAFQAKLTEEYWEDLKKELNATPPVVDKVPKLLNSVTSRLVTAVPKKYQQRVNQEMRDVLDWDMLKYRLADPKHLSELMRYVISKVISFGAPAREEELKTRCMQIAQRLTDGDVLGEAVVDMFKFLMDSISTLLDDIKNFQLSVIKPELAHRAAEFQRNFTDKCLPAPPTGATWPETLKWLMHSVERHPPVQSQPSPTAGASETQLDLDSFFVRDCVINGLVDLLSSANTCPETRWDYLPTQTLYFDKAHIFTAANVVQLLTLRLMIVGTVQLILTRRKITAANTTFLKDLDATLVDLLSNKPTQRQDGTNSTPRPPMTLDTLKTELVEEVNMFLADRALNPDGPKPAAVNGESLDPLSKVEADTIRHAVETMTTTTSLQYTTFEKRVIGALRDMVHKAVTNNVIPLDRFKVGTSPTSLLPANFAFANHVPGVQAELYNTARDLSVLVQHHLEVYSPYYEALLRDSVSQPPADQ